MTQYCYLNGKILPTDKASVSVEDIGLLRGYAVFDFFRTYNGKPFLFNEHWQRLQNSAKQLLLKVPLSKKETLDIIEQLKKKNKLTEVNVRIMITGGKLIGGLSFDHKKPTVLILVTPFHAVPKGFYQTGVKLLTLQHTREQFSAKTSNYITAVKHGKQFAKSGAFEVIFHDGKYLLEAATSNIFIIKNGKIITPKSHILYGTTRNEVVRIAKKHFKVEEREVLMKELLSADEVFITATNKEILPVTEIDMRKVGNGKVGTVTTQLMQLFADRIDTYLKTGK